MNVANGKLSRQKNKRDGRATIFGAGGERYKLEVLWTRERIKRDFFYLFLGSNTDTVIKREATQIQ